MELETGAVAAVILAAGEARRAGGPKSVWPVRGTPSVRRVALAALNAPGIDAVTVVTGAWAPDVRAALAGLPLGLVHNPDYAEGQAGSVASAVRAMSAGCRTAIFFVADQPFVASQMIGDLIKFHLERKASMTAPFFQGRRRSPMVFDLGRWAQALINLRGDQGGRALAEAYPRELTLWPCDGLEAEIFLDFDTAEDYRSLTPAEPAQGAATNKRSDCD
ncbi:MAG: nucleotidyltransferase family protein [Candidatus Adiutrix sp.]|jgi:molybdenum cofactor cytidylyltransferase|nr:nucleotidyltransferase family protein [Candidatus Adiutrix sp.]